QLAIAVVNDADRAGQAQLHGSVCNLQSVLGIFHAAAQHGVDIHLKNRVLREQLQSTVQSFQTFFRYFVGHGVVDADLQVLQAGVVQAFDALFVQEKTVGDHSGNHSAAPDVSNHFIEIGMHQRLTTADGDNCRAHVRDEVQAALHLFQGHRVGHIID